MEILCKWLIYHCYCITLTQIYVKIVYAKKAFFFKLLFIQSNTFIGASQIFEAVTFDAVIVLIRILYSLLMSSPLYLLI